MGSEDEDFLEELASLQGNVGIIEVKPTFEEEAAWEIEGTIYYADDNGDDCVAYTLGTFSHFNMACTAAAKYVELMAAKGISLKLKPTEAPAGAAPATITECAEVQ